MKLKIALGLMVILLVTTAGVGADAPEPPLPGPAMVDTGEACWIFDINMVWYELKEGCSPQIGVITNSRTGLIIWTAKAKLPEEAALPELGAYVVTYENSGFCCYWDDFTLTTNYSIVITPDGWFNIECIFRPDRWQPE